MYTEYVLLKKPLESEYFYYDKSIKVETNNVPLAALDFRCKATIRFPYFCGKYKVYVVTLKKKEPALCSLHTFARNLFAYGKTVKEAVDNLVLKFEEKKDQVDKDYEFLYNIYNTPKITEEYHHDYSYAINRNQDTWLNIFGNKTKKNHLRYSRGGNMSIKTEYTSNGDAYLIIEKTRTRYKGDKKVNRTHNPNKKRVSLLKQELNIKDLEEEMEEKDV